MNEWSNYTNIGPNDDWTISIDFWLNIQLIAKEEPKQLAVLKLCELSLIALKAPAGQGANERGMNPIKKNHTKDRNRLGKPRLRKMIFCELTERWESRFK